MFSYLQICFLQNLGRAMWKFSVQARNRQTQFILAVADVLISVRDINDNKVSLLTSVLVTITIIIMTQ